MSFNDATDIAVHGFNRLKEVVAEFPDDLIDDCAVWSRDQEVVVIVARGPNAKHLIAAYEGRPK